MKTMPRILTVAAMALGVSLGTLGVAGSAQARSDVYWSVGAGSPGVAIGVGNVPPVVYAPPVYVQPAPVYVQPRPVYVQPRPVYVAPGPYYATPPVVYRPAPYRAGPRGHHRRHHKRPNHHWR